MTNSENNARAELTAKELEDSMVSLSAKLSMFNGELSCEERAVFTDIIASASKSLSKVEVGTADFDLAYEKPVQKYITNDLRKQIKKMTDDVVSVAA